MILPFLNNRDEEPLLWHGVVNPPLLQLSLLSLAHNRYRASS